MSDRLYIRLREVRTRAGWSASALAEACGLSRQAYAAIESGRSVPGTDTALCVARMLGVRVEELWELKPPPPHLGAAQTCAVRVGEREVMLPMGATSGLAPRPPPRGEVLVVAGCDPATSILAAHIRERRGVPLLWLECGSESALHQLARGETHAAGSHLPDTPARVTSGQPAACVIIHVAVWEEGLVVPPGNPLGLSCAEDLARQGVRIVNRPEGSACRRLLDVHLARAGVPVEQVAGYRTAARGHLSVADAVASGLADAGVATRAAATAYGLSFVPWEGAAYRLIIPRHLLDEPPVCALLDVLSRPDLRAEIEALGGYDGAGMGQAA